MYYQVSSGIQPDIVQEFVRESYKIIDCLGPALNRLAKGGRDGDCWQILGCGITDCHLHGKNEDFPCWLHLGHFGGGLRACPRAESAQACRSCKVFWEINGDTRTTSAVFRLFHAMRGCADFLHLQRLADVSASAESLLHLIITGKVKMEPLHIELISQACDFATIALGNISKKYSDETMAAPAAELSYQLTRSSTEALARVQNFQARLAKAGYDHRASLFA